MKPLKVPKSLPPSDPVLEDIVISSSDDEEDEIESEKKNSVITNMPPSGNMVDISLQLSTSEEEETVRNITNQKRVAVTAKKGPGFPRKQARGKRAVVKTTKSVSIVTELPKNSSLPPKSKESIPRVTKEQPAVTKEPPTVTKELELSSSDLSLSISDEEDPITHQEVPTKSSSPQLSLNTDTTVQEKGASSVIRETSSSSSSSEEEEDEEVCVVEPSQDLFQKQGIVLT